MSSPTKDQSGQLRSANTVDANERQVDTNSASNNNLDDSGATPSVADLSGLGASTVQNTVAAGTDVGWYSDESCSTIDDLDDSDYNVSDDDDDGDDDESKNVNLPTFRSSAGMSAKPQPKALVKVGDVTASRSSVPTTLTDQGVARLPGVATAPEAAVQVAASSKTRSAKKRKNHRQKLARAKKRALKRKEARQKEQAVASDQNRTLPSSTKKRSPRPKGGSNLFLRLESTPPINVNMVSMELLQSAFPHGMFGQKAPAITNEPSHGGVHVPVATVPQWIASIAEKDDQVDVSELDDIGKVVHFNSSAVGTFTSFLVKCIINRRTRTKQSDLWVRLGEGDDSTDNKLDPNYTSYVVILPHAGVFLSDHGVVLDGSVRSLVPMPLKWLGIHDCRPTPKKAFVKRVLTGPGSIFQIVCSSCVGGGVDGDGMHKLNVVSQAIEAYQIHDNDVQSPLLPPNAFYDVNTKSGRVGTIDHGAGLSTEERRQLFQSRLQDSRLKYVHCRRYVRGSRHTETSDDDAVLLDYHELGPFDIRIECKGVDGITTHVSYLRVRKASDDVTNAVRSVGQAVAKKPGNARAKSGDGGKMFATGSRFQLVAKDGVLQYVITKKHRGLLEKIQHLNTVALRYLQLEFNELVSAFHLLEHANRNNQAVGESALTESKNPDSFIVPSMNFTVDLWNAPHFDVHDGSYGLGMWASDNGEDVKDWEFILPNVVVESGVEGVGGNRPLKGTRIRLFDGCVLSWEGTEIRHGTARMADKEAASANHTYSSHWCSSAKQHTLALKLANKK